MLITDADRRWSKAMKYYIENEDEKLPPDGRFNYGQKLFFWLMFYGVILLADFGHWTVVCRDHPVEPDAGCAIWRSRSTWPRHWPPLAVSSSTSTWARPWCAGASLPSFAEKFPRLGQKPITGCGMSRSRREENSSLWV